MCFPLEHTCAQKGGDVAKFESGVPPKKLQGATLAGLSTKGCVVGSRSCIREFEKVSS